jgi:predicted GIY-YIG superfamily endonuclease
MHYVYLIESHARPARRYVGMTADLKRRVQEHNSGKSVHTRKYKPWTLATSIAFSDRVLG